VACLPGAASAAWAANSAPVASPDSYTRYEDTTLSVSSPGVLGNDFDADGNSLSTVLVSNSCTAPSL